MTELAIASASYPATDQQAVRTPTVCPTGNMTVIRKLVFMEREVEKISEIVDDLFEDEWLEEEEGRDIRDCIINIEIQLADLQELHGGSQVAK